MKKVGKKMNNIVLIGRLVKDPELRTTGTGKSVTNINIAVNRPTSYEEVQQTDFINIQAWNKLAENLCKYQKKGSQIAVEGALRIDNYTDVNGDNKYKTYVLANNIMFLDNKKSNEVTLEENTESVDVEFDENEMILTDDDLPF